MLVDEPTPEDAISILRGLKERYENHHHVRIQDDALIAAVTLSHRYISDRFLPRQGHRPHGRSCRQAPHGARFAARQLDEISRRLRQLEIEREAIRHEADAAADGSHDAKLTSPQQGNPIAPRGGTTTSKANGKESVRF